jgi:micrococcal nuclease
VQRILKPPHATIASYGFGKHDELSSDRQDITGRIQAALGSSRLTAWQRGFLNDMLAKHQRYGPRTRLSPKQHAMLHRLIADLLPEPAKVAASEHRQARFRYSPRRPRSVFRQTRAATRQASLVLVAIIGMVMIIGSFFQAGGNVSSSGAQSSQPSAANQILNQPRIEVIDGDTIRVSGQSRNVRLVGFNTPETGSARCSQERALGHQASARLKQLVANGTPSVTIVPCACQPGTHGTQSCNFGRACGVLKVDGRDVGETLVAERLAVRFRCGATGCPPMPRPWCG